MATKAKRDADLRANCAHYARKYGYSADQLERGLEGYAVHLFAQEEGFDACLEGEPTTEADLREYICRSADLGIDGVLEDEAGKRIILIQSAWRASGRLDEDKISAFFDAPSRIGDEDFLEKGSTQTQELLAGFADKLKDGYEVSLRFVTNLAVADKERLQVLLDAKNRHYEETTQSISCELYGIAELISRHEELQGAVSGGIADDVSLAFQDGKILELEAPFRTVVGVIKANELVNVYRRKGVGNTLFNLNIRLPLASRKVNPRIATTASSDEEGPYFFYYNNGVSAVCSSYVIEGTTVVAKRLQVINGAQTVSALVKALRSKPNAEVYVLFRLTETNESYGGKFTENIIRYNNTQNPVKVSDFFSNDPIQVWLRDNFTKLSGHGPIPTMYYIHKSGHKPKGATGKGIKIEHLAGIRHAFNHGPVPSYREPAQFFDRDLRYHEAFGIDGREADLWPDEELYKAGIALAVHERAQAISKNLKANEKTRESDEAKYLYRLARYVTGLVGVGLEAIRDETFNDYATLAASSKTFTQYVEPIMTSARNLLRLEWKARSTGKAGVQPEYNLARDDATWARLSAALREEVLSELVLKG